MGNRVDEAARIEWASDVRFLGTHCDAYLLDAGLTIRVASLGTYSKNEVGTVAGWVNDGPGNAESPVYPASADEAYDDWCVRVRRLAATVIEEEG